MYPKDFTEEQWKEIKESYFPSSSAPQKNDIDIPENDKLDHSIPSSKPDTSEKTPQTPVNNKLHYILPNRSIINSIITPS